MPVLSRTELNCSDKPHLLAKTLACQDHGDMSQLAQEYGLSRPTLYRARNEAEQALLGLLQGEAPSICAVNISEAQLKRAIVALGIESPNSIRAIQALIPILYPTSSPSYGYIQGVLAEAQHNAAVFNRQVDLSKIINAALDEMFSQGDPVLAGVCLDSGYLFSLAHEKKRDALTWKQVLLQAAEQGMSLHNVVKDGAKGIAKGVSLVYPNAKQRDDVFHAVYITGKAVRRVEQRAYYYIRQEELAFQALGPMDSPEHDSCYKAWSQWADRCERAIARYESAESSLSMLQSLFSSVCHASGELMTRDMAQQRLTLVIESLRQARHKECDKAATYLENRVRGLTLATDALHQKLSTLCEKHPKECVELACRMVESKRIFYKASAKKQKRLSVEMLGSYRLLSQAMSEPELEQMLAEVEQLIEKRHRASSAVEGFNATLRTYLYARKGVNQGFLELFQAWYNLHPRRWGRHQGKSAYEVLTGTKVGDWLTLLGFPPEQTLH
jgi:hypothetical protein